MKECLCGGKLKDVTGPLEYRGRTFENIPGQHCEDCGELYTRSDVLEKLDKIIDESTPD